MPAEFEKSYIKKAGKNYAACHYSEALFISFIGSSHPIGGFQKRKLKAGLRVTCLANIKVLKSHT